MVLLRAGKSQSCQFCLENELALFWMNLAQAVRFHIQKLPYIGKRVENHPPHQTRQLPENEVGKMKRKEKVGSQGVGGIRNHRAL